MKTDQELRFAVEAEMSRDLLIAILRSLPEETRKQIVRGLDETVLRRNHVVHQELVDESARQMSRKPEPQDSLEGQSRASQLSTELSLRQRAWGDLQDRLTS